MRSIFGWSLPPGCGTLPGEESEAPCCENCPEEVYEKCPGQDKCMEFYLTVGVHACCVEHRVELFDDGSCGDCLKTICVGKE